MTQRFVFLAALCALPSFAQSVTGTVTGLVRDPNGASVPGAKVTARNAATKAEASTSTNTEGFFRIDRLPPADYFVEVEAAGFRKSTISPQHLGVAQNLRVDVSLEIGQVTESVMVEASATAVNTEDAQLGQSIRSEVGLPVLSGAGGRNVLSLAGIMPGVVYAGQLSTQAGGIFSANGQRAQANNYMLDGTDSNDLAINVPNAVQGISPNALGEFRIVTGAMKAEFGRNSGSITQVITKDGGNEFHGIFSETLRNTKLNAVPFFQKVTPGGTPERFSNGLPRKPQWNSNDFDATLSGPIFREKTFFTGSYLGFRRRQGVTNQATVPSDAQRALVEANGTAAAKALLAMVPRASSGNTLFSAPSNSLDRNNYLAKVNHHLTERNRLTGTFFFEDQKFTDPFAFGGSTMPGFGTSGTLRFYNVVLGDTHTFSPTLTNEFRAAFQRRSTLSVIPVNKTKLSSLGLTGINPDDADAEGPPWVVWAGFSSFGNTVQGPQGRYVNTFHYIDNVSWVKGRHYVKFGGEYRTVAQNQVFDFINNGQFSIDGGGAQTGVVPRITGLSDSLSDFAAGYATFFVQNSAGRRGYRTQSPNLFFQDDFKLRRNLTLNLGVRWEYNTPLYDIRDRVNTFRAGQQSTVYPDAPRGLVYPGDSGISRSTYDGDKNNFGPRIGLAWDPFSDGKWSVRTGWGVFFDTPISELTLQFLTSAPFAAQPIVYSTNLVNPWATSRQNPLPQPFPFQPVQPGGRFNFANIAPIGLTIMDPDFATPYGQQFSLNIQRQVGRNWLADLGYVGSLGTKLLNRRQINPAVPGPGASTGNTAPRRILNLNNPQSAQYGGAVFGGVTDQITDARSNYHSLQMSLNKRFSSGFAMTNAFTWSKAIDDASGLRVSSRIDSRAFDRGKSEFDVRYRYVNTVNYQLPWMKDQQGVLGRLLGGWGVANIATFQTGTPLNINEGQDRCLCTSGNQRPDFLGGNIAIYDPRETIGGRANTYFDGTGGGVGDGAGSPSFRRVGSGVTFALGAGRFGNFGRNVINGPGILNFDFGAYKKTRITESHSLEFRADFFNTFNHTQFENPIVDINSVNFGRVLTARDPRLIQFALKYMF